MSLLLPVVFRGDPLQSILGRKAESRNGKVALAFGFPLSTFRFSSSPMPDRRRHRGPHPQDERLFRAEVIPTLRIAVIELSWLLSRGYPTTASLKLVGDRHALTERQRLAVIRSSCSDQQLADRAGRRVELAETQGAALKIDGFNLLTTIEAALSGGVVLVGRDGCYRDMASMHGSYRRVAETRPAIEAIGRVLGSRGNAAVTWFLDRPVSNSGRLAGIIRKIAEQHGYAWDVEVVDDPDPVLIAAKAIAVSADAQILDGCGPWVSLAGAVVESLEAPHWMVDLRQGAREDESS
jgi:hypothetical protein